MTAKISSVVAARRQRLDVLVAEQFACSRREAQRLVDGGAVRVNGRRVGKGVFVEPGATVALSALPPEADDYRPLPQPELALRVVCEAPALIVVDKAPGLPTHPLRARERDTLANAVVARFPECGRASGHAREGGAAHRLDRETSGLIIFARTAAAWQALRAAFSAHEITKDYLALVSGQPAERGEVRARIRTAGNRARTTEGGRIDGLARRGVEDPLSLDDDDDFDPGDGGRAAASEYAVVQRGRDAALVRVTSRTGRLHQIRAHMAHIGHPLAADTLYGGAPLPGLSAHLLHAERLRFTVDGEPFDVRSDFPPAQRALLDTLLA